MPSDEAKYDQNYYSRDTEHAADKTAYQVNLERKSQKTSEEINYQKRYKAAERIYKKLDYKSDRKGKDLYQEPDCQDYGNGCNYRRNIHTPAF